MDRDAGGELWVYLQAHLFNGADEVTRQILGVGCRNSMEQHHDHLACLQKVVPIPQWR